MTTIQDLMKANHHTKLQSLLDKYNNPVQYFAEGGTSLSDEELKKIVQDDVDQPGSSDEVLDFLKNNAPRSRNVIPDKNVDRAIESGKVKSYSPEDLNNPSSNIDQLTKPKSDNPVSGASDSEDIDAQHTPKNPLVEESPAMNPEMMKAPGMPKLGNINSSDMGNMSMGEGLQTSVPMAAATLAAMGIKNGVQGIQDIHNNDQDPKNIDAVKEVFNKVAEDKIPPQNPALVQGRVPGAILAPYNPNVAASGTDGSWDSSDAIPPNQPIKNDSGAPQQSTPDNSMKEFFDAFKGIQDTHAADLNDAQQAANKNTFYANLMKGINQFTSGLTAQAGHGIVTPAKVDNSTLDSLLKSAQDPVTQYEQRLANEKNDPNSGYSKALQTALSPIMQKAGIDPNTIKNMNGESLKNVAPWITKEVQTQEMQKYRKQLQEITQGNKTHDHENQALQQTEQLLESARGNPAAAQAEKDMYAASKANSLATLYGDPNKLSPQMSQLLRNEVAKIAAGGSSSQHELDALDPKTLQGGLSKVWQSFSNEPSPANAGAFIKQYQDYANALTKDAQNVIQDKYGRVIESKKDALGQNNYNKLKENYINRFNNQQSKNTTNQSFPKTVVNSQTGHQATVNNDQELQEANKAGFQ